MDSSNNSNSNSNSNNQNPSHATQSTAKSTEQFEKQKTKKPKGIIRWGAIIPFFIFCILCYVYFHFFFDSHAKSLIEWGGYKALGAEVNVSSFKSSFTQGKVEISKIELTSSEKPEFNALEIAHVGFDLNWDALLRMKFVVRDMGAEGLQFMSKRARAGKVAPPEPGKPDELSFTDQLKTKAMGHLDKKMENNILGDIAGFLKGGDVNQQLKNIESTLGSKKLADDLNQKWTQKKTEWDSTLKALPTQNDLNSFKSRFEGIKYKDFKNLQELESSVNQFNSLKKDIDHKVKVVETAKNNLNTDLQSVQSDYQNLNQQIKADVDSLKTRLKIPKLDAGQFAKSMFMDYLTPFTIKLDHYKKTAQKYLPPKYALVLDGKKVAAQSEKDDDSIQPLPREEGQVYEFPITTGYPLFWIQNVKISSKSNAQVDYGDIAGSIKNITSNQRQINKETTLDVKGDFKSQNVFGINLNAAFNNIKAVPEVRFALDVVKYFIHGIDLVNSGDGQINIPKSNNSIAIDGKTVGFKTYDISLRNEFKDVAFSVTAKDATVNEILKSTFAAIDNFDLKASAKGEIKSLDIDISSSLGQKLEQAFGALLQKKLDEVNAQIKAKIDEEVAKARKQVEDQVNALKNQVQGEVNKAQAQLDQQKKLIDDRIAQAKKDLENQAKNKLQDEAKKAAEDLKKKLGF